MAGLIGTGIRRNPALKNLLITLLLLASSRVYPAYTMIILGDRTGTADHETFTRILQEVRIWQPELLINVGDLVEGYTKSAAVLEQQWDTIIRLLRATEVPYRLTPGNHDVYDSTSENIFLRRFGRTYYSFDFQNSHFTIIDNSRWDSAEALPATQLSWLQQDLAAAQNARWRFVFMHRSFWMSALRRNRPDKLHQLFQTYRVNYVFSGHDHFYCQHIRDGITYTQLGPSGSRYKQYDQEERGALQGYLLVRVSDDAVRLTVLKPGGVLAANSVTWQEHQQLDSIDAQALTIQTLLLSEEQALADSIRLTVRNITREPLVSRCIWQLADTNWRIEPETISIALAPQTSTKIVGRVGRAASRNPYPLPVLHLSYPYGQRKEYQLRYRLPVQRQADCFPVAPPEIDGRLNDKAWHQTRPLRFFAAAGSRSLPTEPFEVYLGYDDSMVYLAARCRESEMASLRADETIRDGQVANDDNLNLLLCPDPDSTRYYQLVINPLGTVWDRRCGTESGKSVRDAQWNIPYQLATARGNDFWTLELALPRRALAPEKPTWGFNIARYQARNQTVSVFQTPFAHDPAQMARLRFVAGRIPVPEARSGLGEWWQRLMRTIRDLQRSAPRN